MAYKALNNKAKTYIKKFTDNDGTYLLNGRFKKGLPNSDIFNEEITFTSNVYVDGIKLTNNKEFGEYLISWIDKYSKLYELDANIIAIQLSVEAVGTIVGTGYKRYVAWAYSPKGAVGISQFTPVTFYDVIYRLNKTFATNKRLTTTEISALIKDLEGDKQQLSTFSNKSNRQQLHQNAIDNPEIMVKLQCMLMSYIGKNNNNLATSTLYCYNRGSAIVSESYLEAIKKTKLPIKEGIEYVRTIFETLVNEVGYPKTILDALIAEENGIVALNNEDASSKIKKLTSDQQRYVNELHYLAKNQFANLIFEIQNKTGYAVKITSGYRTFGQQQAQYEADNRNAEPGLSHHNYGLAIDINLIKGSKVITKSSTKDEWIKTGAVDIAKKLGFTWGGDFSTYYDPVHFDLQSVYPINKLYENANILANNDLTELQGNKVSLFG